MSNQVFINSCKWLSNIAIHEYSSLTLKQALHCLFGLWLCHIAKAGNDTQLKDFGEVVYKKLDCSNDFFYTNTNLCLLAIAILSEHGFDTSKFCLKQNKRIQILTKNNQKDIPLETKSLIQACGIDNIQMINIRDIQFENPLKFLLAEKLALKNYSDNIVVSFNSNDYNFPLKQEGYATVAKALLVDAVLDYDLETASMMLRTLLYFEISGDKIIQDAVSFFELQQLENGSFGRYEIDQQEFMKNGLNTEFDLYLPITVSILWTLAEVYFPNFKVFSTLSKRNIDQNLLQ
jgi:hypothetical protein